MRITIGHHTLELDDHTGALRSYQTANGRELLATTGRDPLFVIQQLQDGRFVRLSSHDAQTCTLGREDAPDETRLRVEFTNLGGVDITVTVRLPQDDPLTYWTLELRSRTPVVIADISFPYVLLAHQSAHGAVNLVVPTGVGRLHRNPAPHELPPDSPSTWRPLGSSAHFGHYPGTTFAQFLAWYDDADGVYLGCHDAGGGVKMLKPVHHDGRIRLGVTHVVGWDGSGERRLGYDVALGAFTGDWYDAADRYDHWYRSTHPRTLPLEARDDVPDWLLAGPLHVVMRIRGELDSGPATEHEEFTPYENALPALDRLSAATDSPLVPVVMAWERPGPWVYPESFPVVGGDEALRTFVGAARQRGWHVGTYCNGTNWVTAHHWTGYNGSDHFATAGGERAVCRDPAGTPVRNGWDQSWRSSHPCCVASETTQQMAVEYVRHLQDLGLDWIQFLDQNNGAASFPCYASDHGHPPAPGAWMTTAMEELLDLFKPNSTSFSVESGPNDHLLRRFPMCDVRPHQEGTDIPLFAYLFHDLLLSQSAFALAPNPYWMQLKTAYAFVTGDLPAAILGPDGRLMNWAGDQWEWATWDRPPGDQQAVLTLLRRTLALRRGRGRDFLVYGRLQRPCPVSGIEEVSWLNEASLHRSPAVMHACWRSHGGVAALALANWTTTERAMTLPAQIIGPATALVLQTDAATERRLPSGRPHTLRLPPLSCGLVLDVVDDSRPAQYPCHNVGASR